MSAKDNLTKYVGVPSVWFGFFLKTSQLYQSTVQFWLLTKQYVKLNTLSRHKISILMNLKYQKRILILLFLWTYWGNSFCLLFQWHRLTQQFWLLVSSVMVCLLIMNNCAVLWLRSIGRDWWIQICCIPHYCGTKVLSRGLKLFLAFCNSYLRSSWRNCLPPSCSKKDLGEDQNISHACRKRIPFN